MGYMRSHSIIVSYWKKKEVEDAHAEAVLRFGERLVSNMLSAPINDLYTFLVGPDGSKEFWYDSNKFDKIRDGYIKWIACRSVSYVELSYNDEYVSARIINEG